MGVEAKPDFSGYATKAGLQCSDGRTIMPGAFKDQDKTRVPLVWQHGHGSAENVLGHAILEHREDGVYTYGYFNDTPQGKSAKILVQHGDVTSLSIYANQLTEKAKKVIHGLIREVSLVLAGANPGALIDNVSLAHGDGEIDVLDDEAVIYTGLTLSHDDVDGDGEGDDSDADGEGEGDSESDGDGEGDDSDADGDGEADSDGDGDGVQHSDDGPTVQSVYDSMSDDQKSAVHYMVGAALEGANKDLNHNDDDTEGRQMTTHNVFEDDKGKKDPEKHVLTHDALVGIVEAAKKNGSLKGAVEDYALAHGIENIEVLFPDARNVADSPEFLSRRVEWVDGVLNATKHSPFSRIRSLMADLTYPEARAKGYIKGNFKKEEWISVSRRSTTPATIYKKQKLDRDDIVDITDFDVVMWLKAEMRLMFDEELARAILIGDGRDVGDEDKVKDPIGASDGAGIRSILYDHDLYAPTFTLDDSASGTDVVDGITTAMTAYKGSGNPTFYTTLPALNTFLLTRDDFGRRLWKNAAELAMEMGVDKIVTVEVMEDETDLIGIIVNLRDYTIGADKGGELSFFDFFDIDYNQYKYLYESRLSGALTKIRSAVVIKRASSGGVLATPVTPDWDGDTLTVATTTGVVYKDGDDATLTHGSPVAVAPGESITVYATPTTGYYFTDNIHDEWTFTNNS